MTKTSIALVVASTITIIAAGYLTEDAQYKILSCNAEYSKYWVAEFSESGIDAYGDFYSESWEEVVTEPRTIVTINGNVYRPEYAHYLTEYGYYVSDNPSKPRNKRLERSYEFDRYKLKHDYRIEAILISVEGESYDLSIPVDEYKKCISSLDRVLTVSTWYTLPSSIKFVD